jgi:hypothetical protein
MLKKIIAQQERMRNNLFKMGGQAALDRYEAERIQKKDELQQAALEQHIENLRHKADIELQKRNEHLNDLYRSNTIADDSRISISNNSERSEKGGEEEGPPTMTNEHMAHALLLNPMFMMR